MKEIESNIPEQILDTLEGEQLTNNISKISFIFVAFLIAAGGYVTQIFSCSTQRYLDTNIYGKHLIGIGLIFIFIMLEGGFNFNAVERDMYPVDWSNGNCSDSMIYAFIIYFIFLLSSKMRLSWNTAFFVVLFILYVTNTQRLYMYNRKQINAETNDRILMVEKVLLYSLPVLLFVGLGDYYFYKQNMLGSKFSLYLFFLGNPTCKGL